MKIGSMKKWIFSSLSLLALTAIQAQTLSTSPYSAYGIGKGLFDNNTEQGGMGDISTLNLNPYGQSANFYNPAANQSLRMTTFNISLRGDDTQYKYNQNKEKSGTAYISNLSLAFPVSPKSRAGFGYQPYSTTGFDVIKVDSTSTTPLNAQYQGEGGINSVHAFYSYNVTPEISVGARANFLFGDQNKNEKISVQGGSLITDYDTKTSYSGYQFAIGTVYNKRIGDNHRLNIGATYTLGTKIKSQFTYYVSTYNYNGPTMIALDTISYIHNKNAKTQLPNEFSFAASYGKDLKWNVAAEIKYAMWSDYSNPVYESNTSLTSNLQFKDSYRAALGAYYIPNFNSYKSYLDRVIYRGGIYYERGNFNLNYHQINNYGATLGFGLPVGKTNDASMLNIALEYGKKGSTKHQLVQENYIGFRLGFDFNDIWFRKRVID